MPSSSGPSAISTALSFGSLRSLTRLSSGPAVVFVCLRVLAGTMFPSSSSPRRCCNAIACSRDTRCVNLAMNLAWSSWCSWSCFIAGLPISCERDPTVHPSNAVSIATASAHLEPIVSTPVRASMKRANEWFVLSTTRKPMTKPYIWKGYGCAKERTISSRPLSHRCSQMVIATLTTAKGRVRGKGLPWSRRKSGRPQYPFA
mmetsp:Transcript_10422/g.42033  ORF Transcript_10422/g.42033 Transcript_10422/m.42033 type:complete len:202 (+) Transcript_10422:2731-3336(+)